MMRIRKTNPQARHVHGLLILVPALLLAGIGGYLLWNDWRLAEQEARQRAQETANRLVTRLTEELFRVDPLSARSLDRFRSQDTRVDESPLLLLQEHREGALACLIDTNRSLAYPPPMPTHPSPEPISWSRVGPETSNAWHKAQTLLRQNPTSTNAARILNDLTQVSKLPDRLRAMARYRLGIIAERQEQWELAWNRWKPVTTNSTPKLVSEAGLPVRHLAHLGMLRISTRLSTDTESSTGWLESVASDAVLNPSLISQPILDRVQNMVGSNKPDKDASVASWRNLWATHQQARKAYAKMSLSDLPSLDNSVPTPHWIEIEKGDLSLLTSTADTLPTWFIFYPRSALKQRIEVILDDRLGSSLFEPAITIAGRDLTTRVKDSTHLASASSKNASGGAPQLNLSLYLTDPSRFYAQHHRRTLWFGALILAGVGTVVFGYWVSTRGFRRQQELNAMKTNFVSSVSHEMRAPISAIQLMTEELLATESGSTQKSQDYHRYIVQDCVRLSRMINNVLDFSRLEQGRKEYERVPTDLLALFESTIERMRPLANQHQVELVSSVEGDAPESVEVDGTAIQQVLTNLIDNAITHGPNESVVHIRLRFDTHTFRMTVRDKGPGIPEKERQRIFDRFYRVGSELRRESRGIGLGLTLVREVVEAHGGRSEVNDDLNQGTQFIVEIPYVAPHSQR